jgi:signal transduction histidine kinase
MTPAARRHRLHYTVAIAWLVATVSLASWWLAIGLSLPDRMHRMFVWEGAAFIGLLVAGGVAIVRAIRREHLRRQALETFFMSFTHDLKTSLASVGLQAENLREDWPVAANRAPLDRLLHDLVRLQIQLENSLFVAQPDGRLLREPIATGPAIARLAEDWPELTVNIRGSANVVADARAFDAVVRNVLQNAVVHGGAHCVEVTVEPAASGDRVRVTIADDGRGVEPEIFAGLGQPFARGSRTSGTGVGLFVCSQLTTRMNGILRFLRGESAGRGLTVVLELPGRR